MDADTDSDGDGISNYDEYVAGTDPNNSDIQPPEILSRYPSDGTVATQGNPFEMVTTFADSDSGIATVVLLDENGVDISSQAVITGNTITLTMEHPENKAYQYQLILTDEAGNKTIVNFSFTIDSILPYVMPSVTTLHHDTEFEVDLTCSEAADIYYSTDGYPPFVNAANTIVQTAPVTGISIDKTTHLQYFAIDEAGNIGPTESIIYQFDSTIPVTQIRAQQVENENYVTLSWDSVTQAANYYIYRVANPVDKQILEDCVANGIAPPARLRLSDNGVTGETTTDDQVVPGTTYYYGITVNTQEPLEGPLSELASIEFTGSSTAQDKDEAIQRAKTWLKANQGTLGSWGNEKNKLLVTSQVLNAFKALGEDEAAVRKGVFFLRGNYADNNDFLGRQINTLYDFEQNVDYLVAKLISQAYISGTTIYGWGTRSGYYPDPVSTAVGASTVSKTTKGTSLTNSSIDALRSNWNSLFFSSDGYCFSWVADADASVYVSSLTYHLLAEKYPPENYASLWQNFSISWILDTQTANGDGSFGNGSIDTGACQASCRLFYNIF
nr:chitobiase/beta-hexosaminidase C-terminal domain-containing protein [uncultured Desulfobacter sp.]